jgi:hypothetical protein
MQMHYQARLSINMDYLSQIPKCLIHALGILQQQGSEFFLTTLIHYTQQKFITSEPILKLNKLTYLPTLNAVECHKRKNDINNGAIEVPKHKHHVAMNNISNINMLAKAYRQ